MEKLILHKLNYKQFFFIQLQSYNINAVSID